MYTKRTDFTHYTNWTKKKEKRNGKQITVHKQY